MGILKEKIAKANNVKTSSIPNWIESLGGIIFAVIGVVILSPFAAWYLPIWLLFGISEERWSISTAKRGGDGTYTEYSIPESYESLPIFLGFVTLYVFYRLIKNYETYSPKNQTIINVVFVLTVIMAFISSAMGLLN